MKRLSVFILLLCTCSVFAQSEFENFEEAKTHLETLFDDNEAENITVYKNGYIILDMGAACAGRYLFKLQDVAITQQKVEDYYRCGAMNDKVLNISFDCKGSDCILDPFMLELEPSSSGSLTFVDLKRGLKIYNTLTQMQKLVK